jgi:hypothetical protein
MLRKARPIPIRLRINYEIEDSAYSRPPTETTRNTGHAHGDPKTVQRSDPRTGSTDETVWAEESDSSWYTNLKAGKQLNHMPAITINALLDTNEVSKVLKISPATLESWRSRGNVHAPAYVRVGKRAIRYTPESIQKFIEASRS